MQLQIGNQESSQRRIGRREQQLMVLLSCEVIVYICTNLLFSINITYSAITVDEAKTIDRLRIEGFISYLSTPFIIIINNCVPFYLYLIVSQKFRQDLKKLLTCGKRRMEQAHTRCKASGTTAAATAAAVPLSAR